MKPMKKRMAVCLLLSLLLSLCACAAVSGYADDVSTRSLAGIAESALADGVEYTDDKSDTVEEYFPLPAYVSEKTVRYARDTENINEFGIFHVANGSAEALAALLREKYLAGSLTENREFYNSYIPTETSKLESAEVRTYGNYVVYAILNAHDRATLFSAVESALKKTDD